MGKRVLLKKVLSTSLAVVMAASMCFIATPSYKAEAATKKASIVMTQTGVENDVAVKVGKKVQLKVNKDGAALVKNALTYKVTKGKNVAQVTKTGVIIGKKKGDAEIIVKEKKGGYSTRVYVEVTATGAATGKYKIEKIWLDKAAITLEVGEGYHFGCYARGEDKNRGSVRWGCDDGNIVEVHDGGYIRAVGHGTTRVYATKGGHTAACLVTVN